MALEPHGPVAGLEGRSMPCGRFPSLFAASVYDGFATAPFSGRASTRPASAGDAPPAPHCENEIDLSDTRFATLSFIPAGPALSWRTQEDDLRVFSTEVSSDALTVAQVMRRSLLDQATSKTACFGDALSAQISSGGQKLR